VVWENGHIKKLDRVVSGRDGAEGHTNFRGRVLDCEENGAAKDKAILRQFLHLNDNCRCSTT